MADIRVRVGQQNAVKILSSASGGEALTAITAQNVIGGIGSIAQLDKTVLPLAKHAAIIKFSVAPTDTFVNLILDPFSPFGAFA